MTVILGLDTAAAACSVAVLVDGAVRAHGFQAMAHGQAEALAPMMQTAMAEAGLDYDDLDAVAVTVGPGSFTGIRIGLSMARGVALAADKPCLGLTTLDVLAEGAGDAFKAGCGLAVMDTRRRDVYAQVFTDGVAGGVPVAVPYDELAALVGAGPVVVAGDVAARAVEALTAAGVTATALGAPRTLDASWLAAVAARRFVPGAAVALPTPLYLHPPVATVPKNGGRLRP